MLYVFLGIMMGQLLYMCTLWLQHRRKEYAYYIVHYIIFIYFLLGLSYTYFFSPDYIASHQLFFSFLQFQPLHIFNYYLYIRFAQHFLETTKLYKYHNREAINMMKGVLVCTAISVVCWFFMDITSKQYAAVYLGLSVFLMIWAIRLVYLIYTMHTRQSSYLFKGSLLLSIGIFCTYIFIGLVDAGLLPRSVNIFYPGVLGILGEIYFVNAGLNYKASIKRKQLIRIQQQWIDELERNRVLLQEKARVRNDLSLQLNKEIGVTLNGISLFAEHSLQRLGMSELKGVEEVLHRIVVDSNKMVSSMNDIIWELSADNDTMTKTIQRIRSFSKRYCNERGIECEFLNTGADTLAKLDMELRRVLYAGYRHYFRQFVSAADKKLSIGLTMRGNELELVLEAGPSGRVLSIEEDAAFANNIRILENFQDTVTGSRLVLGFKTHPTG